MFFWDVHRCPPETVRPLNFCSSARLAFHHSRPSAAKRLSPLRHPRIARTSGCPIFDGGRAHRSQPSRTVLRRLIGVIDSHLACSRPETIDLPVEHLRRESIGCPASRAATSPRREVLERETEVDPSAFDTECSRRAPGGPHPLRIVVSFASLARRPWPERRTSGGPGRLIRVCSHDTAASHLLGRSVCGSSSGMRPLPSAQRSPCGADRHTA